MIGPSGEECRNCYFWVQFDDDPEKNDGSCHRMPPTIPHDHNKEEDNPGSTRPFSDVWIGPNTNADDWCGEFRFKRKLIR